MNKNVIAIGTNVELNVGALNYIEVRYSINSIAKLCNAKLCLVCSSRTEEI